MRASSWNQISISTPAPTFAWIAASSVGKFFERLNGFGVLGIMARPGGELAKTERTQFAPQCLPAHRYAELIPKPLHEIEKPPAHHAVEIGPRPSFDSLGESGALRIGETRRFAGRLAIAKAIRPLCIETHHRVADNLKP